MARIDGMGDQGRRVAVADLAQGSDARAGKGRRVFGQGEIERVVRRPRGDADDAGGGQPVPLFREDAVDGETLAVKGAGRAAGR